MNFDECKISSNEIPELLEEDSLENEVLENE